jgi:hypothetical protein
MKKSLAIILTLTYFVCIIMSCQKDMQDIKITFANKTGFDLDNIIYKNGSVKNLKNLESSSVVVFDALEDKCMPEFAIQFEADINGKHYKQGSKVGCSDPTPTKLVSGNYRCDISFEIGQDGITKVFILKLVQL